MPHEKQIEFPPEQTHVKRFELFVVVAAIAMAVAAVLIILTYTGSFIGPWG